MHAHSVVRLFFTRALFSQALNFSEQQLLVKIGIQNIVMIISDEEISYIALLGLTRTFSLRERTFV